MSENQQELPIETKKPKKQRPLSPEMQKLLDEKNAVLKKIADARKAELQERKQRREDERAQAFTVLRYIQRHVGDKAVRELVGEVGKELAPHEGYPVEKVEADKAALRRLLGLK